MMQKTEFQISGYLYRRGIDNSSWSNRYVTLSTDTGAMKLYMEKSGKRTIKGQLNIKKSKFSELTQEQAGRQFAFELITEDLQGKSEEAHLILSAPDQEQYEEWKKSLSVCFTIGDSRRRKSVFSDSTSSMSASMTDVKMHAADPSPVTEASNTGPVANEAGSESVETPKPEVTQQQAPFTEIDDLPGVSLVEEEGVDEYEQEENAEVSNSQQLSVEKPDEQPNEQPVEVSPTIPPTSTQQHLPHRVASEDEIDRSIRNAALNAQQNIELSSFSKSETPSRPRPVEIERKASVKFDDEPLTILINSPQPSPAVAASTTIKPSFSVTTEEPQLPKVMTAASPLAKIFGESPTATPDENNTNSAPTTLDSEVSSETNSPAPGKSAVAQKLEKKMARLSFKKPNFKNLLNDNGLDEQMKQELEIAADVKTGAVTRPSIVTAAPKEPEKPARTPVPPRQLSVHIRPTEPTREGYLQKLDSSSLGDLGEDSWLDQYVTLDIASGEMKLFAEIGGKLLLRETIATNKYIIRSIEYVFYGKVFSFEFIVKNEDGSPSEEAIAVFAADDLDKFSYWMVSFRDCQDHQDKLRMEEEARQQEEAERKRKEEEEAAAAAAAEAAAKAEEEKRKAEAAASAAAAVLASAEANGNTRQEARRSFRPFEGASSALFASLDDIEGIQHVQYTGSESNRSSPAFNESTSGHKMGAVLPEYLQSPAPQSSQPQQQQQSQQPQSAMKSVPSSNRLLTSANVTTPMGKSSMHERIPTASNIMRTLERQPSHRGMSVDAESHEYNMMHRHRSYSAAPDLESRYHHPLAAIFNPADASHGVPHTSMRIQDNNSPLDLMSPSTALMMQQMFVPEVENLTLDFSKVHYPMERLARRIKIWYCSSGFSIASEKEVENFVRELRNTDDKILHAFSQEKFAYLNDWAKLLEMLRKYEEHSARDPRTHANKANASSPEENELDGHLAFVLKARTKGDDSTPPYPPVTVAINETLDIDPLARKLSSEFSISESVVSTKLLGMLSKKDSVLANGFKTLKEDMTFAEDLVLYQEEVIEHMWQSYTALKGLIEQKDAVINQLYSQLSEMQEKLRGVQLGTDMHLHTSGVLQSTNLIKKLGGDVPDSSEVKIIADREFNNADKDGDGRISRDEWRKWIEDKHNLIQEHNSVKAMLMEEIRILRKSMNPQSQQTFEELKRSEEIRHRAEEELIRAQIANDSLREDLATISLRLKDVEQEKAMQESDWQEKFAAMQRDLEETKQKLADMEHENEQLKEKQQQQQQPLSINPATPIRLEAQHTHGYGYSGFSPMQFPSYSAPRGVSLNPYSYNVTEDRLMAANGNGGDSVVAGIAMDPNAPISPDNFGALDLQTIANSDVGSENHAFAQSQQTPQSMLYGSPMLTHPAMMLLQQQQFLIQQQQQQLQQASQLLASSSSVVSAPNNINNSNSHNASSIPPTPSQSLPIGDAAQARRSFTNATPPPVPQVYSTPHHNPHGHDTHQSYSAAEVPSTAGSAPFEFRSPDDDDEYMHQPFARPQPVHHHHHPNNLHHYIDGSHSRQSPHAEEMYNEAKGSEPNQQHLSSNNSHTSGPNSVSLSQYQQQKQQYQPQATHPPQKSLQQSQPAPAASPQVTYNPVSRSMDHPLRNALRTEVRSKHMPVALPAAVSSLNKLASSRHRSPTTPQGETQPHFMMSPDRLRTTSPATHPTHPSSQQTPTTPSYAAPIAKRTTPGPKTPLMNPNNPMAATTTNTAAIEDGRAAGGARAGSPQRFMQGTNSWKKKAILPDRSAQENIIMRASNWR